MYTEENLKKMMELFNASFEYSIMETSLTGTKVVGYCNEADNPQEQVYRLNNSGSSTSMYTYVKNSMYTSEKALDFVEILANMLRDLGPSIFSSISLAELAMRYHKSTVV